MHPTKQIDLAERPKSASKTNSLNTRDALLCTNLENYKKTLTSIVGKISRQPSNENIPKSKSIDRKFSQSQCPVYNINVLHNNLSSKYFINQSYEPKDAIQEQQVTSTKHKRCNSGDRSKSKKEFNRSLIDNFMKSEMFQKKINRSLSTNKMSTQEDNNKLENSQSLANMNLTFINEACLNSPNEDANLRETLHKLQLRDAVQRQEITKLNKSNELLRAHIKSLEKEVEKNKKNRELEAKYMARLESEITQLKNKEKEREKEKSRNVSQEKKPTNFITPADVREKEKYTKIIEELNKRIANITAEKKLVEDLLKNALLQNEVTKKNKSNALETNPSVLGSIDLNVLRTSIDCSKILPTKGNHGTVSHKKSLDFGFQQTEENILPSQPSVQTFKEEEAAPEICLGSFVNKGFNFSMPFSGKEEQPSINDTDSEVNFSSRVKMPTPMLGLKDKVDLGILKLDLTKLRK